MRRDINDLQNKTVTKDELQGMMDSNEAELEAIMDTNMDGLKKGDHGRIEKFTNREAT
jgi:hypothetical protein